MHLLGNLFFQTFHPNALCQPSTRYGSQGKRPGIVTYYMHYHYQMFHTMTFEQRFGHTRRACAKNNCRRTIIVKSFRKAWEIISIQSHSLSLIELFSSRLVPVTSTRPNWVSSIVLQEQIYFRPGKPDHLLLPYVTQPSTQSTNTAAEVHREQYPL